MPLEAQDCAKARSTSAGTSLRLPPPLLPLAEEVSRSPAARMSLEKRAPSISAEAPDGSGNAGIGVPEAAALEEEEEAEEPEGRRAP